MKPPSGSRPSSVSSGLLNYLPVSGKLVIAELIVPERLFGHSLLEANLRKNHGINLISVRNGDEEYGLFTPEYRFRPGDVALVSGLDESVEAFAQKHTARRRRNSLVRDLGRIFGGS